jgi:hypothetical protein
VRGELGDRGGADHPVGGVDGAGLPRRQIDVPPPTDYEIMSWPRLDSPGRIDVAANRATFSADGPPFCGTCGPWCTGCCGAGCVQDGVSTALADVAGVYCAFEESN